MQKNSRFHLIDALRGIASMWVVLYHAYEGSHIDILAGILPTIVVDTLFKMGKAGVPIFFVISGFVISHSLTYDKINNNYFLLFILRRSIRLNPPYWASILLFLFFTWVSAKIKHEQIIFETSNTIIANIFYAQGFLELKNINEIYWTLCLEIQFYLVFCLLTSVTQYLGNYFNKINVLVLFGMAIIAMLWPLGLLKENLFPGLFLPHWHAFLLGVFAYWSWKKKVTNIFFYIYSALIFTGAVFFYSTFSIAAVLASLFIHECSRFGYISSMNWKWLQFLGTISYSLYLTHNPITGASFFIIYKLIGNSVESQLLAIIIDIIACTLFAYFFWWCFEKWSLQLSRKINIHNAKA